MAKANLEVKVIPPEATLLFTGIALHAIITSGTHMAKKDIAKYAFDVGEEVLKEARERGWKVE